MEFLGLRIRIQTILRLRNRTKSTLVDLDDMDARGRRQSARVFGQGERLCSDIYREDVVELVGVSGGEHILGDELRPIDGRRPWLNVAP